MHQKRLKVLSYIEFTGLDVNLENGDLESRSRKRNHSIPENHVPTRAVLRVMGALG